MNSSAPETVIAIYRVQAEKETEFFALMRKHHPTLLQMGLATAKEPIVYHGSEGEGQPIVFEIFDWKNSEAPQIAHETPEVMQIWEAMGTMVEERDGKPKFEFPHVKMVDLSKVGS